jgi:FMN phosphatase YigB (HAD superfamily)
MKTKILLIFDLDDTLYARYGVVADNYSGIENIKIYEGVKEILTDQKFEKVLVTMGDKKVQDKKIVLLGIKNYFSSILICSDKEQKKECFQTLTKRYPKFKKIVIGDRRDSEIKYGNELNLITILIKSGKYKDLKATNDFEIANYEINNITELSEVLNKICKQ